MILMLVFGHNLALAQTSPMSLRYQTNTTGNIEVMGNAIVTCIPGSFQQGVSCEQALQQGFPSTPFGMQMIDIDSVGTTFNSSSSDLTIPANANVLFAGLYWSATEGDIFFNTTPVPNFSLRNTVLFDTPATAGYQTITGTLLGTATANDNAYGAFADITSLVQAAGSGTYTTANIQVTNGFASTGPWGGWSMAVVYEEPSEACRNLTVFDGFELAFFGNITVPITGFQAPPTGPVEADFGFFMGDGDIWNEFGSSLASDSVQFDGQPISDALNPYNAANPNINRNFFNNNLTRFGVQMTSRDPYTPHTLGTDITMISADGILPPGSTSTSITLDPSEGLWWPMMTSAIQVACPLEVTKTAVTDTIDFGDAPDSYSTLFASSGPNHQSVFIPGSNAQFDISVNNLSTVDAFTMQAIEDSVFGDLNGQGNCSVPQVIAPNGSYSCSFTTAVNGTAGTQHTNIVTVSGVDADNRPISGTANDSIDLENANLLLGSTIDIENDAQLPLDGSGDGADEDGLIPLQKYIPTGGLVCTGSNGSYTTGANEYCAVVTVTNNSSDVAQLAGWLDYDGDGVFSLAERSQTNPSGVHPDDDGTFFTGNIPATSGTQNYVLVFTGLGNEDQNTGIPIQIPDVTMLRLRVTTEDGTTAGAANFFSDASPSPTGPARDGEVEDHIVAFDILPVTLSSMVSELSNGKVKFDWSTSSELFNVGFQLWGLDGKDTKWEKLHGWLVRSGAGNTIEPQSYTRTVSIPGSINELIAVGVSSIDADGSEHYFGPFEVGKTYGNLNTLKPIAWDHIRQQVDTQMASRGYIKDSINGYRKASMPAANAGSEQVIEVSIREPGIYKITAQDLLDAGVDWSELAKQDIALIDHLGTAVVRYISAQGQGAGKNRTLGNKGEIYFYSSGINEKDGLYGENAVYRLIVDRYRAVKAQYQPKQGINSGFSPHYMETSRLEKDSQYVLTSAADDPWVEAVVLSYPHRTASYAAGVAVEADALWTQSSMLTLQLARRSNLKPIDADGDGVKDAEHIVDAQVLSPLGSSSGLLSLGTQKASGSGLWNVDFEIPANTPLTLIDGKAVIGGIFSAGSGYAFSEVHVDAASLSYARPYTAKADHDYLMFTGPDQGESGYAVTVPDTGWPVAFAYNDKGALVRLALESQARFNGLDGSRQRLVKLASLKGASSQTMSVDYWVSGKRGFMQAESLTEKSIVSKSTLLAQASGSNYLMISHPMFSGSTLEQYAQFKRGQGYRVSIIDYLQIVDSFGGGQPGPYGLTNYLSQVEAYSDVEHVLLVGGSSYDHTNKLGTGAMTFIPGHYGQSSYSKFTVSDVPYITDTNNNLFSSIGRWPVRSESDLQTIVDKSIRWSRTDHSAGRALVIAEHTVAGEDINFGEALDGVLSKLPSAISTNKVYVDDIRDADPSLSQTQAIVKAKSQILDQLAVPTDIVLYNGHGTTSQLSNKGLFKSSDVANLNTQGAEIWLPMSCYVTYYESTHVNTLAYQLLFEGSAVNISGATLLSNQSGNILAGTAILDGFLNQGKGIGEAVNDHKKLSGSPDLNINWAVLGDPTQTVRPR